VQDAIGKGARLLTGGHRGDGAGLFYEPTVLVDVDHTMKCMTEETFGPTLPIMKVRDAEEAVRLANESPYGLAGCVFTRDTTRGEQIARQVEAGSVCVNDAVISYAALEAPFGGFKKSGVGARHGSGGIRKFARPQSILITPKLAFKREVHMYPYSARTTKLLGRLLAFIYGRGERE
jgi:acyl-CoA reductase-like NAD-dependent aldehyde dehydrogenase